MLNKIGYLKSPSVGDFIFESGLSFCCQYSFLPSSKERGNLVKRLEIMLS